MSQYSRPSTTEEALEALQRENCVILAGGTDFYPAHVGRNISELVIDINNLNELRPINETDSGFRIGALTTWTDIIRTSLPEAFNGLKEAAKTIGGMQTQNAGTLCGNICNASPAADSVPNLMALDAKVELRSVWGTRELELEKFILGNRQTARKPDELVTGLLIPRPSENARGAFEKLGSRSYLVISIVMLGAVVELNQFGEIQNLRISVGACSPVAQRLHNLENDARGQLLSKMHISHQHLESLSPIDDVRAPAQYRKVVVRELLRRIFLKMS